VCARVLRRDVRRAGWLVGVRKRTGVEVQMEVEKNQIAPLLVVGPLLLVFRGWKYRHLPLQEAQLFCQLGHFLCRLVSVLRYFKMHHLKSLQENSYHDFTQHPIILCLYVYGGFVRFLHSIEHKIRLSYREDSQSRVKHPLLKMSPLLFFSTKRYHLQSW
jgi:hypothetical protein